MNTKLFLAEDDVEDLEFFIDIVSGISPDIQISVAKNGIELLSLLESEKQLPDFIFLDLNMPLKNGIECLQEIKKSSKWGHIKTVILSTSCPPEQKKELYIMGADLCLQKPNSFSTFKDTLTKCLQMDWATLK